MHHPDVVGQTAKRVPLETSADVDFKMINEAFSVFSNDLKRRELELISSKQKVRRSLGTQGSRQSIGALRSSRRKRP